jgi:hypothetical protein
MLTRSISAPSPVQIVQTRAKEVSANKPRGWQSYFCCQSGHDRDTVSHDGEERGYAG